MKLINHNNTLVEINFLRFYNYLKILKASLLSFFISRNSLKNHVKK